jgi:hypothetical protein
MRALAASLALLGGVACTYGPTTPVTPRDATPVNASFERTWRAVIDVFAERNIPIATIDKTSGLIATTVLTVEVPEDTAVAWADCGSATGGVWPVTRATYNVLVRGDSVRSTAKVTVRWAFWRALGIFGVQTHECVTKHVWERAAEANIKARAEKPLTTSAR